MIATRPPQRIRGAAPLSTALLVILAACSKTAKPASGTGGQAGAATRTISGLTTGSGSVATTGGAGGSPTSDTSIFGTGGGAGAGGGSGAGGNAGAGGGSGAGGGNANYDAGTDDPEFEGIDMTAVPVGLAPSGCVGGFDPTTKTLRLTLSSTVSTLWLAVISGTINANGVPVHGARRYARNAGWDDAAQRQRHRRERHGDSRPAHRLVPIPWFSRPTRAFVIDLGGGTNAFFLRGTRSNDTIVAGTVNGTAALDLSGQGQPTVSITGVPMLTASLGPGNDAFYGVGINGGAPLTLPVEVYGGDGNDVLEGGMGDDILHGGNGNDIFRTMAVPDGADIYDGGGGLNEVDYSARTKPLTLYIDGVAHSGEPNENDTILLNIQGLHGGQGGDVITGSPNNDVLVGGSGNDIIHGGEGNDTIHGGDGDDQLYGDDGDDYIYADTGTSALYGGAGDNVLVGATGFCTFDGGDSDGNICVLT